MAVLMNAEDLRGKAAGQRLPCRLVDGFQRSLRLLRNQPYVDAAHVQRRWTRHPNRWTAQGPLATHGSLFQPAEYSEQLLAPRLLIDLAALRLAERDFDEAPKHRPFHRHFTF